MQENPRSTSTLELVVNEQQLQNMSQIDLNRIGASTTSLAGATNHMSSLDDQPGFSFKHIRKWPSRVRESFGVKFDEAKAKSESKTELVFHLIQAFSGLAIWLLCFLCTIIIPIILLFIGLLNIDNCQARPLLPYCVFATGFFMTASNLFNLAFALDFPILSNHQILSNDVKNTIANIINIIFNSVVAFLYILSAYMVLKTSIRKLDSEDTSSDLTTTVEELVNCSAALYYFTFWFVVLTIGLLIVFGILALALFLYNQYRLAIIRGSTPRSQQDTSNQQSATIYATDRV